MRSRLWIFAAVVLAALVLQLAAISARIGQSGEDNVRARLAAATNGLRGQLELLDARLSPRPVATLPDLIEATRAPADPTQPLPRPDSRALRAAASAVTPEPDLLAVVSPQGAIVSRRATAAQSLDDGGKLPLAKAALDGNPQPSFALYEGAMFRVAATRIPGNGAAVILGTQVDDRLAAQLKSQIDADVTLLQGGKVIASSLQAEERARVARWAASPAPGYGVVQVRLPGIGTALTGKLPRGTSRYAVRGALVPLDSGVQAALTVPAAPYVGWLARYQAFYLLALALFVLFSLLWGLFARAPRPAVVHVPPVQEEPTVGPVRTARARPSLIGTDVGEPRTAPPPTSDVPWPAPVSEPPEVRAEKRPEPAPAPEPLDPELPPAEEEPAAVIGKNTSAEPAMAEHPMWSADPFTPTAGLNPPVKAEPPVRAEPPVKAEPLVEAEPPIRAQPPVKAEPPPASSDFSFAGLLDEAQSQPADAAAEEPAPPLLSQDYPDTTVPGGPSPELLAQARGEHEPAAEPFPGDEPTRIEPVSAALLDKLRERDEELLARAAERDKAMHAVASPSEAEQASPGGFGPLVPEESGDKTQETPPLTALDVAEAHVTMHDFSLPALESADPDEAHWHETYDKFRELKAELGEPDRISFEKFAAKLKKNRADMMAKHNCKGVRFSVYEKDGKAAIKASAVR